MTADEAMNRINTFCAHAWMVRTFLKHAEEIEDDETLLAVPRTIFDFIRALEPSFQRGDAKEYLSRVSGKLPKLRRVAELFAREHRNVSDHTNFQMASASLSACVEEIAGIVTAVKKSAENPPAP